MPIIIVATWITCFASWFTPMKVVRTRMIVFALGGLWSNLKNISLGVNCKTPGDDMKTLLWNNDSTKLSPIFHHVFFCVLFEFNYIWVFQGFIHQDYYRFLVRREFPYFFSFICDSWNPGWGCPLMSCRLPVVEFAYDTWCFFFGDDIKGGFPRHSSRRLLR